MRKIVAGFAASLDGYIEGPNREIDWIIIDPAIDFSAHMKRFDTFLYGRRTYEEVRKMGKPRGRDRHIVISRTLKQVDEGFQLLQGDLLKEIMQLRTLPGKDIALYGGAGLLTSLMNFGLVDRIEISFIPVLLGSGKPMVEAMDRSVQLSFDSVQTYSNGTVVVRYDIDR